MISSLNPDQMISQVNRLVEADKHSEIRLNANGGNSILLVCDPADEAKFVDSIDKNLDKNLFKIVDLHKLLVGFIESNKEDLDDLFNLLQGSVNQIFKAPPGEEGEDFFKSIMQTVAESYADEKIPVLVNTGVLYGAGIESIQIMEHESVMNASRPLILLYPATHEGDSLMFLSKRPASKYRCMIIS